MIPSCCRASIPTKRMSFSRPAAFAAKYAPSERSTRRNGYEKWEKFIEYYFLMRGGTISPDQLMELGRRLWPERKPSSQKAYDGGSALLLGCDSQALSKDIPSAEGEVIDGEYEVVEEVKKSFFAGKIADRVVNKEEIWSTDGDKSPTDLQFLPLARAWKQLGSGLIVPSHVAAPTSKKNKTSSGEIELVSSVQALRA